ncbi:MAG: efflux RND transporter periplasmic adaptor subunit [Helicobacteraceae bacterium]|jgi:macrolide-specific efflux system membrane fusion protein|nr:efflux RND transporter periplasmic adaptor subunit [Helicobacteraceae bacterium]
MKIGKKWAIILLIAASASLCFAFFYNSDEIRYITDKAKIGSIRKTVNAAGEIGAIKLVNVGAQVSGQIEVINVKIGDVVKKGDLIAQIDSETQQNEVAVSAAKLDSYKAQLKSAEVALKIASSKYERSKTLLKNRAISEQEVEATENEYESAKAKVAEGASLVKQTEISLESAKKNLAYTTITAPLDGTIVSLPVKVGQTLNALQNAPTIAQIADLSKIEILIEISEGDILKVKEGQNVRFSVLSEDAVYEAPLKSIDPSLTILTNDQYSGVVGEKQAIYYYARVEYENADGKFRIGMTTQNEIDIQSAENVLIIPITAVSEKNGRKWVKTIADKKTLEKEIIIGLHDHLYIEVKSGLNAGEELVITQMSKSEIQAKESEVPEGVDAL